MDHEWEVSVHDVKQALDAAPHGLLLIDVRTTDEYAVCRIPGALLAPLDQLAARAAEIADLADGKAVVCHCHHGRRSLQAAAVLRQLGVPQAKSMAGGIDAWSVSIDPRVPRY